MASSKRAKKNQRFLREYGVPLEVFEAQVNRQKRKCAICQRYMKRPNFDHNHTTGKPRGALCNKCNVGLGSLNDNPKLLRRALKYLERYK